MAAPASTRAVWKGAISFGLVHIPVVLYSATAETRPKFNLIDPTSMSPVGNKQVSKTTGEAVQKEELVKGIQVEEGQYVVLSKEEIRSALPRSTQTIEIEAFVDADEIPSTFFNKPYYVAPGARGLKPFALLRDVLRKSGKVGVAKVVISTKQHLAALMPAGDGLVLDLLRWADEVREAPSSVFGDTAAVAVSERELKMAEQLVEDMAAAWSPDLFHDEFKEKLQQLVQAKAAKGDVATLQPLPGEEAPSATAEVIDLTDLLRRSLQGKGAAAAPSAAPRRAAATATATAAANDEEEVAPRKRAAATKAPAKARATVKPAPRKR
ncbi:Ku protein [Ramlibacter henchirensis]|jgi:DNA end-binding protein Ku|uniref:Non-homologous end joining protein Ku n=1 Tax=Ramlibacter henchirensis TaxID=204072 RepID=A0A4Z0BST6_9BURK|nr:Ku protein [Ramlibacter henchirensis]TFZ02343.1 Ku protein [Ramlibacter henchirensis]